MKWGELREEEFYDAIEVSRGLCVIPMGCMEMHGEHLPVGTDTIEIEHCLHEAAKIEPVMEFPPFRFGDVQGLTQWKGSIRLTVELEQALLRQLCEEIARNGFKKILLLNSHGGNKLMMGNFIRSTQHDKKDYVVAGVSICSNYSNPYYMKQVLDRDGRAAYPELLDEDIAVIEQFVAGKKKYGHASFSETSLIFGSRPDLVRMDRADAVSGLSAHRADYLDAVGLGESTRFWGINFPNSYQGDTPYGCNERIGKFAMRLLTEQAVRIIRTLKYDDNILRWNEEDNARW